MRPARGAAAAKTQPRAAVPHEDALIDLHSNVAAEIRTRRWNDPAEAGDGTRILITRYRPRGVAKADETWDVWMRHLAPSAELVAAC